MKRLVVCCDGTWSTLGQDRLTNVALTARAIAGRDADGNPQIVYYDDGVGVEVGRMDALSAAFGRGLDYKILEAYEFLTLNYEPGDQIYLFGYSRGAYTVRSLAGFVRKCGILRRQHADRSKQAIELYRRRDISVDSPEAVEFRNSFAAAWPKLQPDGINTIMGGDSYDLRIKYLGVWDTVGALGIPRRLPFAGQVNKKYEFHDLALSRAVLNARQAVAIDEQRNPFTPTLWTNLSDFNVPGAAPRVMQQWFPGDHGGVGGGCATQALSSGPLLWVAEGAEEAGLVFERAPGSVLSAAMASLDCVKGDLGDSLKGFDLSSVFLGRSWRSGLLDFENVHDYARQRWSQNRSYRPRPLKQFRKALRTWTKALPGA
ncbi:MAG: DUF2235 domain-containing protein [Caulobacterales bacterium]